MFDWFREHQWSNFSFKHCSSWRFWMNRLLKALQQITQRKLKAAWLNILQGDWWWPNHIHRTKPSNPWSASKINRDNFLYQQKAQMKPQGLLTIWLNTLANGRHPMFVKYLYNCPLIIPRFNNWEQRFPRC